MKLLKLGALNGWQRLWILLSGLYLVVVVGVAYTTLPRVESRWHTDDLYQRMRPEVLRKVAMRDSDLEESRAPQVGSISVGKVGFDLETARPVAAGDEIVEVEMPNGHLLPFLRTATQSDKAAAIAGYILALEADVKERQSSHILLSFFAWVAPCIAIYILGNCIAWVRRGFRKT